MRTRSAEVIALDEVSATATLRFLDDASERDVPVPAQIHIQVGMPVKVIDIPNDAPIYAWGS